MAKKIINEGGYKVKDKTARKTVVGKLSVASRGYAFLKSWRLLLMLIMRATPASFAC